MKTETCLRVLLTALCAALALGAAWLILRYLLPWLLPFLLAFLTAALLEPAIRRLTAALKLRRRPAAAVCAAVFLAALAALLGLLVYRAVCELDALVRRLPVLLAGIPRIAERLEARLDDQFRFAPAEVRGYLDRVLGGFGQKAAQLPAELSGRLPELAASVFSAAPRALLSAATYAIGVFFLTADYPAVKAFLIRQLPDRLRDGARRVKTDLCSGLGRWLKAEGILMLITFGELIAAFLLLRIAYPVTLALVIAFIDALPILGTGTVLLPWAAAALLSGNPALAASLAVLYGVVSLVRSFLEPKLVGKQLGLHPLATLMAMYIGFCCIGIAGMLLFPIVLLLLTQLEARGVLRLWK